MSSILLGTFLATEHFFEAHVRKYDYVLTFDPSDHEMRLGACGPDSEEPKDSGRLLIRLQTIPEETVRKLATMLDLEPTDDFLPNMAWRSRIPLIFMQHHGSPEANQVISELVRLNLPYHATKSVRESAGHINLRFGRSGPERYTLYSKKDEPSADLIDGIRTFAAKYGKLEEQVA